MHISLDKHSYVIGEPITATVTITNTGDKPVTDRWFAYARGFHLRLEDTTGKRIAMNVLFADIAQDITNWVKTLSPGEMVSTSFEITRGDIVAGSAFFPRLACRRTESETRVPGYVVKPGTYRLVARHYLELNRWPGEPLNELRASVEFALRPADPQEQAVLSLFEAQPSFTGTGADESQTNALAVYAQIVSEYPKSVFAPYALYYIGRIRQQRGETAAALDAYSRLISDYQAFPLMANAVYFKAKALLDAGERDQAKDVASTLRDRFPNYLVAPDVEMPKHEKGSRIGLLLRDVGLEQAGGSP